MMAIDCKLRKGAVELYNQEDPLFAFWSYNYAVFGVAQETNLHLLSCTIFPPLVNTREDMQFWYRDSVESTFLLIYIYLVAVESSVPRGGKEKSAKARKNYRVGKVIFKWKHMKLSCSVNYPVRSRLWTPLTVRHPFPTKFMFAKAQLNIIRENSPSRDVGHIVHPQDQLKTTQFPVCVRRLKRLVKPKWFLVTSCIIAVSFPFSLYALQFSFLSLNFFE